MSLKSFLGSLSQKLDKAWSDIGDWYKNSWLGREFLNPEQNLGVLDSIGAKYTGSRLTGAEREANAFNAEQAQIQRDWEERMANTSYQRTVTDLQNAGLNPALAYGNGAVPTPSGASASSVSPGATSSLLDMIIQLKNLNIQEKVADADIALKTANVEQVKKNTAWTDKLNQAYVDSTVSRIRLTSAQIDEINDKRREISQNIDLIAQQAKTEESKRMLNDAQANLAKMSAREIAALYPAQKLMIEAQTVREKAQADLLGFQAAVQKGLIDEGYVDKFVDEIESRIKLNVASEEQTKLLNVAHSFRNAAKTGQLFHLDLTDSDSGFLKVIEDYLNATGPEGVLGAVGALFENGLGTILTGLGIGQIMKGQKFRQVKYYDWETGDVGTRYVRE